MTYKRISEAIEIGKVIGVSDGTYLGVRLNVVIGPDECIRRGEGYIHKLDLYVGVVSYLSRYFDVRVYRSRPLLRRSVWVYWDDGIALRCIGWNVFFGGIEVYDDYNVVMPIVVNHVKGLCGLL
jgi:hypothetical protein